MFFPDREAGIALLNAVGVARLGKAPENNCQLGAFWRACLDLQFGVGLEIGAVCVQTVQDC